MRRDQTSQWDYGDRSGRFDGRAEQQPQTEAEAERQYISEAGRYGILLADGLADLRRAQQRGDDPAVLKALRAIIGEQCASNAQSRQLTARDRIWNRRAARHVQKLAAR